MCEVGFGNYTVDRFDAEATARAEAAKKWCCWVLFRSNANGTQLTELQAGGVGFAAPAIRKWTEANVKSKARDADARANAAAAAEARAAKLAAAAPKAKSRPTPATTSDGRPDVSTAAAWD